MLPDNQKIATHFFPAPTRDRGCFIFLTFPTYRHSFFVPTIPDDRDFLPPPTLQKLRCFFPLFNTAKWSPLLSNSSPWQLLMFFPKLLNDRWSFLFPTLTVNHCSFFFPALIITHCSLSFPRLANELILFFSNTYKLLYLPALTYDLFSFFLYNTSKSSLLFFFFKLPNDHYSFSQHL